MMGNFIYRPSYDIREVQHVSFGNFVKELM